MTDQDLTRRHLFERCGVGVGKTALAAMLANEMAASEQSKPHFAPKAKSVIYLFMAGGPSQFEMWTPKPQLQKLHGQFIPDSFLEGKRFAFMDTSFKDKPKLLATKREFKQHGQSGTWGSSLVPHTAAIADDLTFLHTVSTENFNHAPAKCFANTGFTRFGRPSMGSWVTYGLGSESKDLPGFVVLQSGPRGPRGGALLWGSGFLPTTEQGVLFRGSGDPILNLSTPKGVTPRMQNQVIDAIRDVDAMRHETTADPEINTRIAAYEMAYRMQTSGPELIDFTKESKETLALYGVEPGKPSFAANCLLARRLVERGVRYIQLWHTDWDHHDDLTKPLEDVCRQVDQPCAALIKDLKSHGLLDTTLVIWGGEFGRTPMGESRDGKVGRNHHIDAYTMWMAGGGTKPGMHFGQTDDFGFNAVEDPISMHDVQATVLNQLGLDHTKLTYQFQGRNFRLTDVAGKVITKILA